MNFNSINFETKFKDLKNNQLYRATSINLEKEIVSGYLINEIDKAEKIFSFNEIKLMSFSRAYDSYKQKIFENNLVFVRLRNNKTFIGVVINDGGFWKIHDYKNKKQIPLKNRKIAFIKLFERR